MEKKVEVILDENRNILIKIDLNVVHTIIYSNRQITAEVIYNILDPKLNDTYNLEKYTKNEKFDKDNDVAEYFYNILKNITDGINLLNRKEEEEEEDNDNEDIDSEQAEE